MAESTGTEWYKTGTVKVTQSSTDVVGTNTTWSSAGIKKGDIFTLDGQTLYEIAAVNSNTSITLDKAFTGATATGVYYAIIRNFATTVSSELAARVALMTNKYESYIDADLTKITGPAANFSNQYKGVWAAGQSYKALDITQVNSKLYVATSNHTSTAANGPTGASSVWLTLDATIPLNSSVISVFDSLNNATYSASMRNHLVRGKDLGTEITAEQFKAISSGKFTDMYLGDYWAIPTSYTFINRTSYELEENTTTNIGWRIIAFDYFPVLNYNGTWPHNLLLVTSLMMPWNSISHDGGINDLSKGYAGTDMHTIVCQSIHDYYTELWGSNHMKGFPNDQITCDNTNNNFVANTIGVTVAPMCFFAPDITGFECGGFYWRAPLAGTSLAFDLHNGCMTRNIQGNQVRNFSCFSKTPSSVPALSGRVTNSKLLMSIC